MKVLSYLEVKIKTLQEQIKYRKWLGKNGYPEMSLKQIYSQTFKPEMIEKYFEGFEKINDKLYRNKWECIDINYYIGNSYDIEVFKYEGNELYEFLQPRTLDDFITDCQRAGIELKWKEFEK